MTTAKPTRDVNKDNGSALLSLFCAALGTALFYAAFRNLPDHKGGASILAGLAVIVFISSSQLLQTRKATASNYGKVVKQKDTEE